MKKLLIILLFILMSVSCSADGVKMIYRDFWVDDVDLKPVSLGACTWTDEASDCQLAGYLNISLACFWENKLRLGMGMAFTRPDEGEDVRMDMRMMFPTITTLVCNNLELGFYASPFYNLYGGQTDDPWGFMVGYAFGF